MKTIEQIKNEFKCVAIPSRGISEQVAKLYGVKTEFSEQTREPVAYYFPVYQDNKLVAYKVRSASEKAFWAVGDMKNPQLFGQNTGAENRKFLIITEGEFDALAAKEMLREVGKNYFVVSLPNGANPAAIKNNLEWLETFDTIVLNFDMDKAGQKAVEDCVELFTPGKVKIAQLPTKDANEMLLDQKYRPVEYYRAIASAKTYRPDGVIELSNAWDLMFADEKMPSIPYPWDGLNEKLYGLRYREIVTLTSGSGMGKSALTRELEHWLLNHTEDNIGILALEESVGRTAWGIVSVEANLPLSIREERKGISNDQIRKWFETTLGTGRIFTLDHFGSTSEDSLLSKVRYMIKGLGCKWIILDHLSIVVSSMDEGGDERKTIDSIMTKLRQLVEETGAGMILVSHLRRVAGDKGHEQGHEVSLAHLRGSQAIAQLSDAVIALERNQQASDEKEANLTTVRILKNRYAGIVGIATYLFYDRKTGRLLEIRDKEEFLGLTPEDTGGF